MSSITKKIWLIIPIVIVILVSSSSVLAIDSHEDPGKAAQIFSGISLFSYYSKALDGVIQLNPEAVAAELQNIPSANIPDNIKDPAIDFASNTTGVAYTVAGIFDLSDQQRQLAGQSRIDEAIGLSEKIKEDILSARIQLNQMKNDILSIGNTLVIDNLPPENDLRKGYEEVLAKIDQIIGMLEIVTTYNQTLSNTAETERVLLPTEITLTLDQESAFVGDPVHFEGVLISKGQPMQQRDIQILLNNSLVTSIVYSDEQGHFQGDITIPYSYSPQLQIQALYAPQKDDIGIYLGSISPAVYLKVLYYEAALKLTVDNPVYAGREATLTGQFDYGDAPLPDSRSINIFLNDQTIKNADAGISFMEKLAIDPHLANTTNTITISVPAKERYAPVIASISLKVILAVPALEFHVPHWAIIPGNIDFSGRLYSELGPLAATKIDISIANSKSTVMTSSDGTFSGSVHINPVFSLLGTQSVSVQISPQEPWYASLTSSFNIFIINYISCGILLVVFVVLVVLLPILLLKRLGYARRSSKRAVIPVIPVSTITNALPVSPKTPEPEKEPKNSVLYWYRKVLELMQKVIKVPLLPHETLREFATKYSSKMGPAETYFLGLTSLVEKITYGNYHSTPEDTEKSQKAYMIIKKEADNENS